MADALEMFPNLNIRNTFLHCELTGPTDACRSVSCPPRVRLASPRVGLAATVDTSNGRASATDIARKMERRMPTSPAAAVARGPPPYAPPKSKLVRQDSRRSGQAAVPRMLRGASSSVSREEPTTCAHASKEDIVPNQDGDWAVVEVKRKKRALMSNAVGEEVAVPAPQQAATLTRCQLTHHHLEIGIEDDREFRVVKRLIGPGGENMDRVRGECQSVKVELRGSGTKSLVDSSGPLVLHIKGHDAAECSEALARAEALVAEAHHQHDAFLANRLTEVVGAVREHNCSAMVQLPCDVMDSQEESTSADDSMHPLNDATDSDADDVIAGDLIASRSQLSSEHGASSSGEVHSPTTALGKGATSGQSTLAGRDVRQGASSAQVVHHEVPVGLMHSFGFPVVKKLLGRGGENMKKISCACPNTKVELRGEGTNPWSGGESGPLVFHIRGNDVAQCGVALKLANELIDRVRKDHQSALESKHNGSG